MDTWQDFVKESEEVVLGATEKGFLEYLQDEYGISFHWKDWTPSDVKVDVMIALKDLYWKEYLEVLNYARNCEIEEKLR